MTPIVWVAIIVLAAVAYGWQAMKPQLQAELRRIQVESDDKLLAELLNEQPRGKL